VSAPASPKSVPLLRGHSQLRAWVDDLRAFLDHGHRTPVFFLVLLDVVVLRNLIFTRGLPAGIDSGFVYSLLPYFDTHGIQAFSGWLSWPLGQEQHYSIYWLLALVNSVVGSPVAVYKGAVLLTMLTASAGSYGLAFWLTKSRLGATVASTLYVLAPFSIAAWLAGHLDVMLSYAIGPMALWAFWIAMRTGSVRAALALGFAGSALFLLTTGQGSYWALPLLAIAAAEAVRAHGKGITRDATARRLGLITAVSAGTFVAASAVQLLPLLAGVKAPFVQGGTHYYVQQLSTHAKYSLPITDNVFGIPREVWLAPGVTIAAASFASLPFRLVSFAALGIALAAPFVRRMQNAATALVLVLATVAAWLLASGPHGPIGPIYRLLYDHVPFFTFLRVPNRWLMVSTLGLSVLTALTIGGLQGGRKVRTWFGAERDPGTRVAVWAVLLGLFLGSYAVFNGLPTWKLPADYEASYSSLKSDRTDWRMLTTPFYQEWMESGSSWGSDLTLAADLGQTSTYWHGHSTLGRGGWDPRAARFATYISELTRQGTSRSLTKLLGAVGVKYIGVNPHHAFEVPTWQNPFFRRQAGLVPVTQHGGVTIYRNTYALPQAFLTPRTCIVAGGFGVLGDLSEQPSFSFGRIGIQYADQLVATGGRDALTKALAQASCVIVAPGGEQALTALLYSVGARSADGMAPSSWERTDTLPSTDIGAEPSVSVSVPPRGKMSGDLTVPRAGNYALWLAGLHAVEQPAIQVRVDGRDAGLIDLRSDLGEGVRWAPSAPLALGEGSHRVELTNASGNSDDDAVLTKVAFVEASASLRSLYQAPGMKVIKESGGTGPVVLSARNLGPSLLESGWRADLSSGYVKAYSQRDTLDVDVFRSGRRYYTIARATATGSVDPYRPIAIRFKGTASRRTFFLNALFDARGERTARFRFIDTTTNTRTLYFSPLQPTGSSTIPDWSSVKEFSLSTNSKSRLHGPVRIEGPYAVTRSGGKPAFAVPGSSADPFKGSPSGSDALASDNQLINDHVDLRNGLDEGTLNFTQSYNPNWDLKSQSTRSSHGVALGFANAYNLDAPLVNGSVSFTSAKYGRIGTWISFFVWMAGLGAVLRIVRRDPRVFAGVSRQRPDRVTLGAGSAGSGLPRWLATRTVRFGTRLAVVAGGVTIIVAVLVLVNGSGKEPPGSITRDAPAFWVNIDPRNAEIDPVNGPAGEQALHVRLGKGRSFYTVFDHRFKETLDLTRRPYLLVAFKGTGSGETYTFYVDFAPGISGFASFQIHDLKPGWRHVSFATAVPQGTKGKLDWSRVSGFRLATMSKAPGEFAIGAIRAAQQPGLAN
jgi:hypothetical protein